MKIGIIKLQSILHDENNYNDSDDIFLKDVFLKTPYKYEITSISAINKFDYIFWFVETGGTEEIFKKYYQKARGPFYLLTTGKNNSLAASMEILSFLKKNDEEGEIIHGDASITANKIMKIIKSNDSIMILNKSRLGVIGIPSDWLISSNVDYDDAFEYLGVKLIDIEMNEFLKEVSKGFIPANDKVNEIMIKGYDKEEIKKALEIYGAFKNIINKYKLTGVTIRCFDLLEKIKSTSCLALALLNSENITATCEGDLQTLITMEVLKNIAGSPGFQANLSEVNTNTNEVIFAHCTVPLNMVNTFSLDTHFESGIGVAIKGDLKKEKVTIFKLSDDFETYFVSKGEIIENLSFDNLCRTQIRVKLEEDVNYFLTNPIGNHHVIVYGDYVDEIKDFFKILLNK